MHRTGSGAAATTMQQRRTLQSLVALLSEPGSADGLEETQCLEGLKREIVIRNLSSPSNGWIRCLGFLGVV